MKRIFTLCIAVCTLMTGFAQTDSTKTAPDTIHVGGMVIIRDKDSKPEQETGVGPHITYRRSRGDKPSNISTNWWIVDLGFSNIIDNTNYAGAEAQAFAPGITEDWMKIKSGKSRNVNIWILMQRLNLAKHIVHLKYGLGLELNNYFFDDVRVRFSEHPTSISLDPTLEHAKKNKLAADYLTVPLMLNFNFTPHKNQGYGFSAGVSAGLLYSARQKTKMDGDIDKTKGDFDLDHWKLSYVAEILLGPVKLYGSLAFKNMWEKGLDHTPYNVGFRVSSW
jgi:hypothetical protein